RADLSLNWHRIEKTYEADSPIEGKIVQIVKGGFKVDIGVLAFLPGSQADIKPLTEPKEFLGKNYQFKVLKIDRFKKNVVLSRRSLLEEEERKKHLSALLKLKEGELIKGKVKSIVDYGAFVEIDGVSGFLHINDMGWGRISHPSQLLRVGEEIEVLVLKVDREKGEVSFGLKQKTPNPWEKIEEKYPVGSKVRGKVVNITEYGAFVKLEEGLEGLLHISELSWIGHIKHPSEIIAMGDELELLVIGIEKEHQKISFSLKRLEPNPWEKIKEKYPPDTKFEGKVVSLTDYGAFVEIEKGIDGLLHISNISWEKIKHPSEILKKGEKVDVVILSVDPERKKIALGMKQLKEKPEDKEDEK
ncbi:MAG: S1 RNA-binding domain-containing protein, partial [Candidatus Omnitrophica bacterium]|nr:S1 RNA-binding domain-containing protein [Candidatus Omnitrophota bacterium]